MLFLSTYFKIHFYRGNKTQGQPQSRNESNESIPHDKGSKRRNFLTTCFLMCLVPQSISEKFIESRQGSFSQVKISNLFSQPFPGMVRGRNPIFH